MQINSLSLLEASTCSNISLTVYDDDGGTVLNNLITFSVGLPTTSEVPRKVFIQSFGQEIAQARQDQASTYSWTARIPASFLQPGINEFNVVAEYDDDNKCESNLVPREVITNVQEFFDVVPGQPVIDAPVNTSTIVTASLSSNGTILPFTQYAIFDWETEYLGSVIDTNNPQVQLFTGPNVGSGGLRIRATLGQVMNEVTIPINVFGSGEPLPEPGEETNDYSTNNTSTSANAGNNQTNTNTGINTTTTTNKVTIAAVDAVKDDPQTTNCLAGALGQEAYNLVNSGQRRPNHLELTNIRACFAKTAYIMPTNFAPVEPRQVENLEVSKSVTIDNLQETRQNKIYPNFQALTFSGQAPANSIVYIYIFSEPLVLSVNANEDGVWTYDLENPLEPGEHTTYAIVDRGDGVYQKTNPFSFIIGTAEATAENPAGLSLRLENAAQETATQSNRSTTIFIISALLLLAFGSIATLLLLRRRHQMQPLANSSLSQDNITDSDNSNGQND